KIRTTPPPCEKVRIGAAPLNSGAYRTIPGAEAGRDECPLAGSETDHRTPPKRSPSDWNLSHAARLRCHRRSRPDQIVVRSLSRGRFRHCQVGTFDDSL